MLGGLVLLFVEMVLAFTRGRWLSSHSMSQ